MSAKKIWLLSVIYLLFLLPACVAKSAGLPPLPPLPEYPAAVEQLNAQSAGEIFFESSTPADFKGLLFPCQAEQEALDCEPRNNTVVKGRLFMPKEATPENKVPAMVVLHGSAGIFPPLEEKFKGADPREISYGKFLSGHGIAAFVVDSYAARGVVAKTLYQLRVLVLSEADEVADAYSAKRILSTHPAIDPERIGLIGFSYGGTATRVAIDARIHKNWGSDMEPFVVHVDYYGPCYLDINTQKTTEAPYYSFRGKEDTSSDLDNCRRLENELRDAGSKVKHKIFKKAAHGWEIPITKKFDKTLNPAPCEIELDADGNWLIAGKPFTTPQGLSRQKKYEIRAGLLQLLQQSCLGDGYVIGRDEATWKKSNRRLLKILDSVFGS